MQEQEECTTAAEAAAAGEAFVEAVAAGDVLRVRQLLREHPPHHHHHHTINAVDHLGWTGLMVAVEARNVEMVELLLASGADPHHRSSVDGMHALHVLAEQGQRDFCLEQEKPAGRLLLQVLLKAGVDPNVPTSSSGETVLPLMCLRGNIEGVRELLARRLVADIDARNAHGDTALHYAARKGHDEMVRLLVAHGASPAIEGRFGTPAQAAIEFGQHHIAELLRSLARPTEDGAQRLGLHSLPPEVVVYMLSFVANAHDLCSLSMVSRALAAVSRDDVLWKPLGHPSWADHHILSEGDGWKAAYMTWLRAAVSQFRKRDTHTLPPNPSAPGEYQVKVVMQGDSGTGKSAILRRYAHDQFEVYPSPTIGAEYERRCVEWQDKRIQLQLWDSSGPERYRSLAYLRGMHGVVVVYDIANRATFDNVTAWVEEMQKYGQEGLVVVVAGNKTDLASSTRRAVTKLEGRRKAEELGVLFCECSAKTGKGVADVFDLLVDGLMGGWQRVAHMATPAHVPSEALLAQLFPHATATATNSSAGASEQQQQPRCALQ